MPRRREVLATVGAGTLLATGVATGQQENGDEQGGENGTETGDEDGAGEDEQSPAGQWLAVLTGEAEVPAVETPATGTATVVLDGRGNLQYSVTVGNIQNVTMAHVHRGAPGENGPVVQWLHPGSEPSQGPRRTVGRFDGVLHHGSFSSNDFVGPLEGASRQDFLDVVRAGEAYVNVHTDQYPDGEIRGQLRAVADVAEALADTESEAPAEAETPTEEAEGTPTDTDTATEETRSY